MKKNFLLLFIFVLIPCWSDGQQVINSGMNLKSIEFFWREAIEMYTMEADDFSDTLKTTLEELKYWRLRVLQDKFEIKISDLEIILSKSNLEELKQLEDYVKRKGLDSFDDTLLMRLAQLHYDRANFDLAVKMKKIKDSGDFSQALPIPDYSKTVFYTTELLKRFPTSSISDHAYYLLGYCLFDEGKDKLAVQVYEKMLTLFPRNPLSFEARWRMAEQYFERNQFDLAKKNYEALVEVPNSFSSKALYKLGASDYSTGEFEKSHKVFLKLFKESSEKLGSRDPEVETLYNESIDYLAHLKAKSIKMDIDEDTDALITKRLAEVYRNSQDEERARQAELAYSIEKPYSRWSPGFLNRVIQSYEYENQNALAQNVRAKFLNFYSPQSAYWSKHAVDIAATVEVQDLYETLLLSSADYFSTIARQNKKEDDYKQAIGYYQKFIDEYSTSPLRNQAKYEMADLQYFSQKYGDAALTYMDLTVDTENDEFRDEAAYGYLLSEVKRLKYDLLAQKSLAPQRDNRGVLLETSELSKEESGFMDATDFYLRNVRKGARRQKVLYKKSEIYFRHNNFSKARENLELIFKDLELSAVAPKALRLLAETYNLENNWEKVIQTTKRASEMGRRQNFESIDNEMLFKAKSPILLNAWKAEKRGDIFEAIDQYEYYSILYPRSSQATFGLLRAGQLYREMGQIVSSNRIFNRLNDDYPDSDYQQHVDFMLAANKESLLDFEGAASSFEKIAKRHSKSEVGFQALLRAGYLRKALGQTDKAAKLYDRYAQMMRDDSTFFEAAKIYQDAGLVHEANRIYNKYTSNLRNPVLALQAYFEKALASKTESAALESCKQAEAMSKKARNGLTASAIHSLQGCDYVRSKFVKNKIVKSEKGITKKWTTLYKYYESIFNSHDDLWISEVAKDLQELKKSVKNEEINHKIASALGVYKKQLGDKYIEEYDTSLLPDKKSDADTILVRWPVESSSSRIAFDQKKWTELEKHAKLEISIKPQGYLYMALARSQAERGLWNDAGLSLKACVEQTKEQACLAALVIFDPNTSAPVWRLPSEDEPLLNLASSVENLRKAKADKALVFAQKAIKMDPQYADPYKYLAQYYFASGKSDLAFITLEQGLRNTQFEEKLLVQKGYLAIRGKDFETAQNVIDDLKFNGKNSVETVIFRAHYTFFKGDKEKAEGILSQLKSANPQNKNIDTAIQTQAKWTGATESPRLPAEEVP